MSRNVESRFALAPHESISRSTFARHAKLATSFNVGQVVPFYIDEVLPGDTFNVKTSKVVRLQTLITPVMDNLYLDTYYFFVPNRLVWEHWKEFCGENRDSAWIPQVKYTVPQITAPDGGWNVGTIADYLGIPTGVDNISVNAMPFRAYAKIIDDWFRDQNLVAPLNNPTGDSTVVGVNTGTFVTDVAKGGLPYVAAKYHDYFTSCLPDPQKGPDVTLATSGFAPVIPQNMLVPLKESANQPVKFNIFNSGGVDITGDYEGTGHNLSPYKLRDADLGKGKDAIGSTLLDFEPEAGYTNNNFAAPANLFADLGQISVATVNQLREAFQLQKLYELEARSGSRYTEVIRAHFGVTSPDARLQRSEYLGGNRLPIIVNQVIQNSETSGTPLGSTGAYSLTTDTHSDFQKSFTEHGFVLGVMVARYDHTYQQGIERFWSRTDKYDYYWPVFAHIGEQPVLNKEIYAQGSDVKDLATGVAYDEEVFGYQEAWADYRYKPNRVTGEMRSAYATSLDSWHFGDDYNSLPMLSDSWIAEDKSNVDRALAVQSSVSNQLFADLYIQNFSTRPMPMYSIPGLIDHF